MKESESSTLKGLLGLLEKCDIYGNDIKLKFQGNSQVKSSFGGILSILTIFIALLFTWVVGQELILRENPNIINQRIKNLNQSAILSGGKR